MIPDTITALAEHIETAGGTLFAVGGFVRDNLLGIKPKDIDFVYIGISPDVFITLASRFGNVDTNITPSQIGAFVCALTTPDGQMFEFALARSESSTGPRKGDVVVSPATDITEDAMRRDVTLNAIFQNVLTGELCDPLNGIDDIRLRILRPTPFFHLSDERVLRVAGMAAILDFDIDPIIVELSKTMRPQSVKGDQNWRQGWSKLGRAVAPHRFTAFLETVGWLPESLQGFDHNVLVGAKGLAEIFHRILIAIGPDRFANFVATIFAPKNIVSMAQNFGKPNHHTFKVIAGRIIMADQPGRKGGKWISDRIDQLFTDACQRFDASMTEQQMTDFIIGNKVGH